MSRLQYVFFSVLLCIICLNACQSDEQLTYERYYAAGSQLYRQNCQNCHNSNGEGLANLIPPLTDTTFLLKNKSRLSCILKHGLSGKISVNNRSFESEMPANNKLADIEIAELITYITNSFGNKQGLTTAVTTGSDLEKCN